MKYFLLAIALMGVASSARGDGLGDVFKGGVGKKILNTVDCNTVCQKDLCGIQNFKDFCETLCSKEDRVQDCKKADPYPFVFEKGKVVTSPPNKRLIDVSEKVLGVFCHIRCNQNACKENLKLANLCLQSCAPDMVVNCKAASGL
ncbi:MAG: hypothetical protein ACRC4G_01255 [Alphaproteobacteria bacterium]